MWSRLISVFVEDPVIESRGKTVKRMPHNDEGRIVRVQGFKITSTKLLFNLHNKRFQFHTFVTFATL